MYNLLSVALSSQKRKISRRDEFGQLRILCLSFAKSFSRRNSGWRASIPSNIFDRCFCFNIETRAAILPSREFFCHFWKLNSFFSCRFSNWFLVSSQLARTTTKHVWISCEHVWETSGSENEQQEKLLDRTIDCRFREVSGYTYTARRLKAFSLVFTRFWQFFWTVEFRITMGSS